MKCQDDKSTTCGRKRAEGNKEAQGTAIGARVDSDAAWERRRRENDVQSSTTMVGRKTRGVPKNQGTRLQNLLYNWKKRCISLS